jgi:hypothetical protein
MDGPPLPDIAAGKKAKAWRKEEKREKKKKTSS